MTNPNQMREVLLFVCSKMADETNFNSKLPIADRTREVWGRKLCWWCLSSVFPLRTFLLGFADSFCFVFASSPSYEVSPLCSILCSLFPWLSRIVYTLKLTMPVHEVISWDHFFFPKLVILKFFVLELFLKCNMYHFLHHLSGAMQK